MGALILLWIQEHVRFMALTVFAVALAAVAFTLMPLEWWCSLAALALIPAIVHASTFDTSDGAK